MKKNIVAIGGGNGSSFVVSSLKKHTNKFNLSAVIPMSDSGGSSGKLRKEFGVLPPGDIMRAILAMSKYEYKTLQEIFYRPRFKGTGKLDNHNLGNLFLTFATQYSKNLLDAVEALSQSVHAVGKVHPVTLESSDLCVELSDGSIVIGEHLIDRPKNRKKKINRAWLQPTPMINKGAKQAIENADFVFMGPGSLYCSVIAALVVEGMKKGALRNSKAKLVYIVGNAYEKDGEAGPETIHEAVEELEKYLPRPLDKIVYNNHKFNKAEQKRYTEKKWGIREFDINKLPKDKVLMGDFERPGGGIDASRLGNILFDYLQKNV